MDWQCRCRKRLPCLLSWTLRLSWLVQGGERTSERGFIVLASFAFVAAILYFAKSVFIPIALALLLTFLLTPLVLRLQKWKFPKAIAISAAAAFAFAIIAFMTWLVTTQLIALAGQLPQYEQNLHAKIRELKGTQRPDVFSRAAAIIKDIGKDLEISPERMDPERGSRDKPLTVEVKTPKPTALQTARRTLGPLLGPAGTAGIVIILVLAMLFKREDLRDRFIKVISGGQLNRATEAVDDTARRISRYLLMQLVVNVTYGIPIGVGLYFIGVPNALLWGVLATVLRFIPYLGPWIAAAFPLALAFAVDPGWTKLVLTIVLFVVIELISNNLVEPWLYGASTGISPVAVIGGALFWTWLWGPVGLFLCTPLTVCVVVLGKYVPGLRFISDMFGSEQVLQPHARFYQRMLAMDAEEMLRMAEEHLEHNDLASFYDQIMIPALILAEEDRQTGHLAEMRQEFIVQSSRELIEDLGERESMKRGPSPSQPGAATEVLCFPAKDDADEISALMLAQVLRAEGIRAEAVAATVQPGQCGDLVRDGAVQLVIIAALPPAAFAPARRLCRRLKQNCPSLRVMVGIWTPNSAGTELTQRLATAHPDMVVTTLKGALQQIGAPGKTKSDELRDAPGLPTSRDRKRDEGPRNPSIPSTKTNGKSIGTSARRRAPEEIFDGVKREVANVFDVPLSFVSIVQFDTDFWKTHASPVDRAADANGLLRDSAVCAQMTSADGPLLVEDVTQDKRLAEDTFLQDRGIQSYAAAPLRTADGHVVGSVCVLDTKPRRRNEGELRRLQTITTGLMKSIESRAWANGH